MNIIVRVLRAMFPDSPLWNRKKGRKAFGEKDILDIKRKWAEIEQLMSLGGPSHFKNAIMEADKLLDHVLKIKRLKGETMGERMKSIRRDDYERDFFDDMWQAHILRNRMSHAIDYEVQHFEAKRAIEQFKRVLKELKAL
jgi:hypothetical protein